MMARQVLNLLCYYVSFSLPDNAFSSPFKHTFTPPYSAHHMRYR